MISETFYLLNKKKHYISKKLETKMLHWNQKSAKMVCPFVGVIASKFFDIFTQT